MNTIVATAAICCVAWAIVAGLSAVGYCQRRGISVNPVFLGIEMLNCLSQYRKLTRAQTGHVGPLFYHYVIPINMALVLVIVLLVVRFT
jgi:hypothetical protein